MTIADREQLLRRIRQIRRSAAGRAQQEAEMVEPGQGVVADLEARVTHLEHLLEGLQDSVHREFERHEEQIAKLRDEIDPAVLGAALAENARSRGL